MGHNNTLHSKEIIQKIIEILEQFNWINGMSGRLLSSFGNCTFYGVVDLRKKHFFTVNFHSFLAIHSLRCISKSFILHYSWNTCPF